MLDFLYDVIQWLFGLPGRILSDVASWIIDVVPGLENFFINSPLAAIVPFIEFFTWIFPFWTILGIMVTAYTIVAGIRAARWVLAAVPFTNF